MKVLILVDRLHWAYHTIAQCLVKYNSQKDLKLSVQPIKKNEKHIKKIYKKYDTFFVLGWQTYDRINFLPKKNTLIGLHSYHSWDKKKTTPDNKEEMVPPKKLVNFLNGFLRVNAVSSSLTRVFKKAGVGKIYYTPNGADTSIFSPGPFREATGLSVGYSGSKAHDWRKGVTKFIEPASKKAGVKLKIAMLSTDNYVDLSKMPDFYRQLDMYVCASSSEGFSLSVLEAAACGLPIISTKVGGCVDLIKDGENGFLVDRNVDAIAKKITLLKGNKELRRNISEAMGKHIKDEYGWGKQSKAWIHFIVGK